MTSHGTRICVVPIALLAICGAASALAAPAGVQRTVPCNEKIDTTPFPFLGNSRPQLRYRAELDAVSVPPAYLQQVISTKQAPWRYWRKAGLVVRAQHAVIITVPPHWRTRAAIVWGNNGGPVESLHIAACTGSPHTGNAYAGGIYLRSPSACLPLIFAVAGRSTTIPRFTPSRLRQMSRAWLNDPANPAMSEWSLQADDLYAGVMLVDLTTPLYRLALSSNFEHYTAVTDLAELASLRELLGA